MSLLRSRPKGATSQPPKAEVIHVSTTPVDDVKTARYYWSAALGDIDAHMVHYDESSFATVFTYKNKEDVPYDEGVVAAAVVEKFESDDYQAAGPIEYLAKMTVESAEQFANQSQAWLEQAARR